MGEEGLVLVGLADRRLDQLAPGGVGVVDEVDVLHQRHGGLAVGLVIAALAVAPMGVRGAAVALSDATTVALAVGTAVLASVIPYCLELSALRRLPRHVFGVLLSLEPIVATFAGWVMLHQSVGPLRLAAITLVIIASIGTTITAARPPRAGAPSQA